MAIADLDKLFEIETNMSDIAFGGQFVQRDEEKRLYLIIFFFKRLYRPELNYSIYNKELITIIKLFREWKLYLNGTKYEVKVYIDYKNLIHFIIFKEFNRRQIR